MMLMHVLSIYSTFPKAMLNEDLFIQPNDDSGNYLVLEDEHVNVGKKNHKSTFYITELPDNKFIIKANNKKLCFKKENDRLSACTNQKGKNVVWKIKKFENGYKIYSAKNINTDGKTKRFCFTKSKKGDHITTSVCQSKNPCQLFQICSKRVYENDSYSSEESQDLPDRADEALSDPYYDFSDFDVPLPEEDKECEETQPPYYQPYPIGYPGYINMPFYPPQYQQPSSTKEDAQTVTITVMSEKKETSKTNTAAGNECSSSNDLLSKSTVVYSKDFTNMGNINFQTRPSNQFSSLTEGESCGIMTVKIVQSPIQQPLDEFMTTTEEIMQESRPGNSQNDKGKNEEAICLPEKICNQSNMQQVISPSVKQPSQQVTQQQSNVQPQQQSNVQPQQQSNVQPQQQPNPKPQQICQNNGQSNNQQNSFQQSSSSKFSNMFIDKESANMGLTPQLIQEITPKCEEASAQIILGRRYITTSDTERTASECSTAIPVPLTSEEEKQALKDCQTGGMFPKNIAGHLYEYTSDEDCEENKMSNNQTNSSQNNSAQQTNNIQPQNTDQILNSGQYINNQLANNQCTNNQIFVGQADSTNGKINIYRDNNGVFYLRGNLPDCKNGMLSLTCK